MGFILALIAIVLILILLCLTPKGQTTIAAIHSYHSIHHPHIPNQGIELYQIVGRKSPFRGADSVPCILAGSNVINRIQFDGASIPVYNISKRFGSEVNNQLIHIQTINQNGILTWVVRECNPAAPLSIQLPSGEWAEAEQYSFHTEATFRLSTNVVVHMKALDNTPKIAKPNSHKPINY